MLRKQSDLLFGIILAMVLLVLAVSGIHPPIVQGILALPFVMVVPGYALSQAIFPATDLKRLERLLFALGLSLGMVILSGLALNKTPWGLQSGSWLMILSGITLIFSVIAIYRRRQIPAKETTPARFYVPVHQVLLLGLSIVLIGFALKLTLTPRPPDNIQGYTSLWILPVSQNQPGVLLIGIHSQELKTTHFHLKVTYNGQINQEWPDISLAPGEQSQQSISLPVGQGLVEASLYRLDNPGVVYRRVSITLNK